MPSQDELYLKHVNERLGELLDEVAALLIWTLEHARSNGIPLNNSLGFHITRIRSILGEIGDFDIIPAIKSRPVTAIKRPEDETETQKKSYIDRFLPLVTKW